MSAFQIELRLQDIKVHASSGLLHVSTVPGNGKGPDIFVEQIREWGKEEVRRGKGRRRREGKIQNVSLFSHCLSASLPLNLAVQKGRRVGSKWLAWMTFTSYLWRIFLRVQGVHTLYPAGSSFLGLHLAESSDYLKERQTSPDLARRATD